MASSEQTVLQFYPSTTSLTAKVHPVVIFSICDCYVRLQDQAERVIGTLLGSLSPDGTIEVKNSYAVPHNESSDQVALDIDCHHNMYLSHQKVNPKEVIVGWIQEWEASIKAYVSVNLSLGDWQLAAQFHEIPRDLRMIEAEQKTMVDRLPSDLEGMKASMERLLALIDDIYQYVEDVVGQRLAPDNGIGRFIMDAVTSIPKMSPSAFDKLVNDRLQDHLLLLYLSTLTSTQLSLAEKLNTAAQIL